MAHEALLTLARLTEAWPWLADMRTPGPSGPQPAAYTDRHQAAIERAQALKDAAAKFEALRAGTVPVPHPDAARAAPIAARAAVAGMVRTLTERVWAAHRDGEPLRWPITDPTTRQHVAGCWYCEGRGETYVVAPAPAGYAGPDPVQWGLCPACTGSGEVPTGTTCAVCFTGGACDCDLADAIIQAAGHILGHELDRTDRLTVAEEALRVLTRADLATRRAAKVSEMGVHLRAPCPACGRRELVAEVHDPNRARWIIRCRFELCVCRGPGCRCGRSADRRMEGRPHVWPAAEWDGPTGLVSRLNVTLPAHRLRRTA